MAVGSMANSAAPTPRGSSTITQPCIRPCAVSAMILSSSAIFLRMVSASRSSVSARLPPLSLAMRTAAPKSRRSSQPIRRSRFSSASSSVTPSRSSRSISSNSWPPGAGSSLAICRSASVMLAPARTAPAISIMASGSCRANSFRRCAPRWRMSRLGSAPSATMTATTRKSDPVSSQMRPQASAHSSRLARNSRSTSTNSSRSFMPCPTRPLKCRR